MLYVLRYGRFVVCTKIREKATFVFPFVWPPPPYPRVMGTLDHPLALVHEQYLPDESVKVRVVRCRRAQSRTAHRLQRDEDQGRLFSSHNAMPCVVPAPSNAHAFTLVSVVQTGISSGIPTVYVSSSRLNLR